jgi:hypothetical protein
VNDAHRDDGDSAGGQTEPISTGLDRELTTEHNIALILGVDMPRR